MRDACLKTLYDLAVADSRVLSLVADNGLIVFDDFQKDFPDRFMNFGISESHMISAAAGMASCGKIPFVYTIGAFLAYRAYEFIRDDVCMNRLNVKIVGIGSGMTYSTLGPSHHATEDIGTLRSLPGLTIFCPWSPRDVEQAMRAAYTIEGPVYIRLGNNDKQQHFPQESPFVIGQSVRIREGKDIALFATGSILSEVVRAAALLEESGIMASIYNVHTLKPFCEDVIAREAGQGKLLFSIEEHNTVGGLGTILADAIAHIGCDARLIKIGLMDTFAKGYHCSPAVLRRMNGLDARGIFSRIISALQPTIEF